MGAYGSPDLNSPEQQYSYGTYNSYPNQQYQYPQPYKLKHHGRIIPFLVGFVVGVAFVAVINLNASESPNKQNTAVIANTPPYTAASSVTSSVVQGVSKDYLQGWAKSVVLEAFQNPNIARFSDKSADWKIVQHENSCDVTSMVTVQGNKTPFRVKFSYEGLMATATFVQIGNKVVYKSPTLTSVPSIE